MNPSRTPTENPDRRPAGRLPRRLAGHRRTTRTITPVLTPLIAVGVAVLTAVSAGSAAGPSAGGRAPVQAAVGTVAFRVPEPAARAIHCSDRSGGRRSGDGSAIQIDILLGRASAGGSTGRRGPLVVGCGPDGQVVVLACAATTRERTGDRRRGERRSDYGSDYGDIDQGDLGLGDLIDLSDALGVDLDSLIELAGMQITGPSGRIDRDRDRYRGDARSLSVWDRYDMQTDTDSLGDGGGLLARLARAASDRHSGRESGRDSDDQSPWGRAGVCR